MGTSWHTPRHDNGAQSPEYKMEAPGGRERPLRLVGYYQGPPPLSSGCDAFCLQIPKLVGNSAAGRKPRTQDVHRRARVGPEGRGWQDN